MLVLATGGTISSRRTESGAFVAADSGRDLLNRSLGRAGRGSVTVETQDVMRVGSYLLKPSDMFEIARRIHVAFDSDDVVGIVVTHGTDTMEESAFLADLVHSDDRPVVFTGAQRAADVFDTDGPRNLSDAVAVAAHEGARGLGALIVFDGLIFPAAGTRKTNTLASAAFSSSVSGPLGYVQDGSIVLTSSPRRLTPLDLDSLEFTEVTVDIVPYYPGAATTAMRAVVADGAIGIILEGTGAGNANREFCREVAHLTATGVVVMLTTRVGAGAVAPLYGAGGGADLVEAGAIPVATLRAPQARMLLIASLARKASPAVVQQKLRHLSAEGRI